MVGPPDQWTAGSHDDADSDLQRGTTMKRAILWFSTLACLALAGLYAYAWFNRDPLVIAFEGVRQGMLLEEVEEILGRPANGTLGTGSNTGYTPFSAHWCSERHR